jgi:universal stress protein E
MQTFSTLLCVIDPTAEAQPALERAAWVGSRTGARLELLIHYYDEYLAGTRFFDPAALEHARQEVLAGYERRLEELAEPLRRTGLTVHTTVSWGHPLCEGIVRHAAAINADIVFKDTHHHSVVSRALFTNTDWSLIRTCASPLWLVKPVPPHDEPIFIAAIDPMNANDKPAALDDRILMMGKLLSSALGGQVHAFHSYDPRVAVSSATANAYIPVSLPLDEIEKEVREQHAGRFRELTEFHGIDDTRAHLVSGVTHEELPALAVKLGASVVIMGAVARNRLQRVFIGATAERTLEHLPCDLLVIKPDWFHYANAVAQYSAASVAVRDPGRGGPCPRNRRD